MNWNKFIPASKWFAARTYKRQGYLVERVESLEGNEVENLSETLQVLSDRISEVEEPTIPPEVKAINFNAIGLPWKLKDDGDGYASILSDDGSTVAVGVPSELADIIIKVVNSFGV